MHDGCTGLEGFERAEHEMFFIRPVLDAHLYRASGGRFGAGKFADGKNLTAKIQLGMNVDAFRRQGLRGQLCAESGAIGFDCLQRISDVALKQ